MNEDNPVGWPRVPPRARGYQRQYGGEISRSLPGQGTLRHLYSHYEMLAAEVDAIAARIAHARNVGAYVSRSGMNRRVYTAIKDIEAVQSAVSAHGRGGVPVRGVLVNLHALHRAANEMYPVPHVTR
jgi:hypothetical protein